MKKKRRNLIVTLLGHVNHGKTSLLDIICNTKKINHEYGGITQNISVHNVISEYINFTILDTPGHESFVNMRKRGVLCTDLILLVIAADDGVMPQTREIIQFAKNEKTPIIVVINKIDKNIENINKITTDLAKLDIISEEWGGDVLFVHTSARQNIGITKLLEAIQLQSELLDLDVRDTNEILGIVIESQVLKGYGNTATVLLFKGKLDLKTIITIGGENQEKIKLMLDINKNEITTILPAIPFYITRLRNLPKSGDRINNVKGGTKLQLIKKKDIGLFKKQKNFLGGNTVEDLHIIVKADTYGGAEAVAESLEKIPTTKTKITIISIGTGNFNENDVKNAILTKSIFIGLNVNFDINTKKLMSTANVLVYTNTIIYALLKSITELIAEKENKNIEKKKKCNARVKEIFNVTKILTVFGCVITFGTLALGDTVTIYRDNEKITETVITTLQHHKNKVDMVKKGMECGIGLEKKIELKENDVFVVYEK
jgi:translation initiation factor IF-2